MRFFLLIRFGKFPQYAFSLHKIYCLISTLTFWPMSIKYNSRPFMHMKELNIIQWHWCKILWFQYKKFWRVHSILPAHIYIRDHPYITSALFWTLSAQENFKSIHSFITVEWRTDSSILNQKGNQRPNTLKIFYKVKGLINYIIMEPSKNM